MAYFNDRALSRIRMSGDSVSSGDSFLMHYGIKGQKWGVRRFQNTDGTLTSRGEKRYNVQSQKTDNSGSITSAMSRILKLVKPNAEKKQAPKDNPKDAKEASNISSKEEKKAREAEDKAFTAGIKSFDSLGDNEKKRIVDEVRERIERYDTNSSFDERKRMEEAQDFLWRRVDTKSGNWNTGDSISENHKKAMNQLNDSSEKLFDQVSKAASKLGYKYTTEFRFQPKYEKQRQKLKEALKNDSLYRTLLENYNKSEQALVTAVLKDIGFPDTPENRRLLFPYVFND